MFITFRKTLLAGAVLVAAAASPALAAEASSSLDVSADVTENCVVSTTPLDFGDVDVTSGAVDNGTGGISVTCTNETGWSAAADAGTGVGATLVTRKMTGGAELLDYKLYTDAGRTILWGDGVGGTTATIDDTGTGSAQSKVIYASILAGQTSVSTGAFADAVAVTVTY